jgi:hypothetical protein
MKGINVNVNVKGMRVKVWLHRRRRCGRQEARERLQRVVVALHEHLRHAPPPHVRCRNIL